MVERFHSVVLDEEKCRGCTNCIKRCPTEAIRVRHGKATINEDRCIDCGECIRICDNHAKKALTDSLSRLADFEFKVALPAPALYGQFPLSVPTEAILAALQAIGFDAIAEVAFGADILTAATREVFRHRGGIPKPLVSSACPAVVRLIQVRFPWLLSNLLPLESPMYAAAKLVRERVVPALGLAEDRVGLFFITPCAAKVTAVRAPMWADQSYVDGAVAISEVYGGILRALGAGSAPAAHDRPGGAERCSSSERGRQGLTNLLPAASGHGIGWAGAGGETSSLGCSSCISVDGIHNVIAVFEELEMGKLDGVEYIEALACTGGCVGGPLTVANPHVARMRIQRRAAAVERRSGIPEEEAERIYELIRSGFFDIEHEVEAKPGFALDEDVGKAICKMGRVEEITAELPGLDCGACGAPTCRALAEDVACGLSEITDCVVKLREEIRVLAEELLRLSVRELPAMGKRRGERPSRAQQE